MIDKETGEIFEIIKENDDGDLVVAKQACDMITACERQMKQIKKQYAEYKQALLEAMEEYGIEKIDTDDFVVSYVKETERVSLDQKKLEKEYPKAYYDCQRVSDVKANVRVRLK